MADNQRVDGPRAHVNSEILDRQPPCDVAAEQAVLGSIMLLPEACDEVAFILRSDDFYDDANRKLYENMLGMHDEGRKIDLTLLVDQLKQSGDLESIGGTAYLATIMNSVATAAHATYYAEIVRKKATLRSLIVASTDILRSAYDESSDARELLSQAEQRVFAIQDDRGGNTVTGIREILHDAMDRIDLRMKGEHTQGGVVTGYTDFDAMTGGMHNSELLILAARPSMGKTALALNMASHVTVETNVPTLFVSLEMSGIELADRVLCALAGVNGHRLRNGTISTDDRRKLVEQAGRVSEAPLYVDDTPTRTMTEIAASARRIIRREGRLGLIVIDYLQLIEPDNSSDPRQEQVAKIARRLKGMARELEVPVLCLAQLNRQAEATKDNRPRLSHLRESGAIEQDADVVMFIHREEYYHSGPEAEALAGQASLIIQKQRNGPIGDIELGWQKDFTRFVNLSPERHSEFDDFNDGGGF
jgi:replicative DNA helicase